MLWKRSNHSNDFPIVRMVISRVVGMNARHTASGHWQFRAQIHFDTFRKIDCLFGIGKNGAQPFKYDVSPLGCLQHIEDFCGESVRRPVHEKHELPRE